MAPRSRIAQILLSCVAVTLLALPTPSQAGRKSCVTGEDTFAGDDLAEIAAVAATIEADPLCDCSNYDGSEPGKRHGDYVRCAKSHILAAIVAGDLRKQCKGTMIKIHARSVCGFPPSKNKVPCVKELEKNGKVICAIKPVDKCVDKPGKFTQDACGGFENCLEATDDNANFLFNADPTGGDNGSCPCNAAELPTFDSTFDAIQEIIFDGYGCSANSCHGAVGTQGGLNLVAGSSYQNLVGVPAQGVSLNRVEPGNPALSFLYEKLAAKTNGTPTTGSAMPQAGAALTTEHLEVIERWIVADANEDATVPLTAELLNTCLPALKLPVPDPPGAGFGAQLRSTPWPLAAPNPSGPSGAGEGEDEICMSTYYNFDGTGLIPADAVFPCGVTINNPSGDCFYYHKQILFQDPISHHSIIHIYTGIYPTTDPGWLGWTYKFEDTTNPLHGTICDPLDVDPATGTNPG